MDFALLIDRHREKRRERRARWCAITLVYVSGAQVRNALNQSGTLTLFVGTCSNWPLSGINPESTHEATLESHSKVC